MSSERPDRQREGAQRIPLSVLKAIQAIVDYCFNDEFEDYTSRDRSARNGHVFRDLLIVRRYLKRIGVVDKNE